jgi:hypothetical protein
MSLLPHPISKRRAMFNLDGISTTYRIVVLLRRRETRGAPFGAQRNARPIYSVTSGYPEGPPRRSGYSSCVVHVSPRKLIQRMLIPLMKGKIQPGREARGDDGRKHEHGIASVVAHATRHRSGFTLSAGNYGIIWDQGDRRSGVLRAALVPLRRRFPRTGR